MTSHYSRRSALVFARLVTAILVLAVCSGKKAEPSASSSAKARPISSMSTDMPEGGGSDKADDVFPRKVVYFKGTIEIKKAPTKVVTLSTGQLDVALTLGIAPIGLIKGDGAVTVPEYLKKAFPKQVDKLGVIKDVGSRKFPSAEDIGNLSPDPILANQASKDDIDTLYKSLSEVAPTVVTQGKSEAWKQDFLFVADALGKSETAKKWMETYQVDAVKAGSAIGGNPTASLLRETSDKLRPFGAVSLAGSVLSDMGAVRPSTQTLTDNGNKNISSETLAEAEADWILYGAQKTPKDEEDKDKNNTELTVVPLQAGLKAINDKYTVRVDDDAFFLNAGPTATRLVMTTMADMLPKKKQPVPVPVSPEARSDAQAPTVGLGVRGICLAYHSSYPVIEDLSTVVTPGAVTVIVGPNACGKSILLCAMSRVLSPSSGQVVLDGHDIATLAPKELIRRVGMLAQPSIAPPGIIVHELVAHGRYPYQSLLHQWSADDDAAVIEAMERIGVVDLADRHVSALSGGQRQRVWTVMALAQYTDIFLLNKPITHLNLAHQVDLLELCRDLGARLGTTIVAVLHDLNQACRYGGGVTAMRAGNILAYGRPEEVVTAEMAEEIFGLKVQIVSDPLIRTPLVLPLPCGTATTTSAGEVG